MSDTARATVRNPTRHTTADSDFVVWAGLRYAIRSSREVRVFVTRGLIGGAAQLFDRIHQHALGSADSPDGAQTAVAYAVINGAARYAEQLGGLLDAHAPAELRLEIVLAQRQGLQFHMKLVSVPLLIARMVPTQPWSWCEGLTDCNYRGWWSTMPLSDLSGVAHAKLNRCPCSVGDKAHRGNCTQIAEIADLSALKTTGQWIGRLDEM